RPPHCHLAQHRQVPRPVPGRRLRHQDLQDLQLRQAGMLRRRDDRVLLAQVNAAPPQGPGTPGPCSLPPIANGSMPRTTHALRLIATATLLLATACERTASPPTDASR